VIPGCPCRHRRPTHNAAPSNTRRLHGRKDRTLTHRPDRTAPTIIGASRGRGDAASAEDAAAGPVYRSNPSPSDRQVASFVAVVSATLRAAGRRAPGAGAHDDALAVAGQHRHLAEVARSLPVTGAEDVEVTDRPRSEVLDLTVAQLLAGGPVDRLDGTLEGNPAGCLNRGYPAMR